jgi:hypothetical protein
MQSFLIDPAEQRVSVVRIDDGLPGIRRLNGFDCIDADETDSKGVTAVECQAHGLRQKQRCRAHAEATVRVFTSMMSDCPRPKSPLDHETDQKGADCGSGSPVHALDMQTFYKPMMST